MRIYKAIQLSFITLISILIISCGSSKTATINDNVTPSHQITQLSPAPSSSTVIATSSTNTPSPTITSTKTSQSTPTISPTILISNTPTLTPSPITKLLPTNLSVLCSELEAESFENSMGLSGVIGGIIPLTADLQDVLSSSIIIGGKPLQEKDFLPLKNIEPIGFSPDGNWFAYQKYSTLKQEIPNPPEPAVYLLSSSGQTSIVPIPVPMQTMEKNSYWLGTWVNDKIMLLQYFAGPPESPGSFVPGTYTLFDVFTGELHDQFFDNLPYWSGWSTIYFSPDTTRAVYISDPTSEIGTSIILWDIEQQKIVWYKKYAGERFDELYLGTRGFFQTAFWSPDSSEFVFTTGEQTSNNESVFSSYLVDRDGKREKVLVNAPSRDGNIINGGLWSPDGRLIYYYIPWSNRAYIYDLALDHNVEICIDSAGGATWSPDSRFLATTKEVNGQAYLILLNVYTGEVTSVLSIQGLVHSLEWVEDEIWLEIN